MIKRLNQNYVGQITFIPILLIPPFVDSPNIGIKCIFVLKVLTHKSPVARNQNACIWRRGGDWPDDSWVIMKQQLQVFNPTPYKPYHLLPDVPFNYLITPQPAAVYNHLISSIFYLFMLKYPKYRVPARISVSQTNKLTAKKKIRLEELELWKIQTLIITDKTDKQRNRETDKQI